MPSCETGQKPPLQHLQRMRTKDGSPLSSGSTTALASATTKYFFLFLAYAYLYCIFLELCLGIHFYGYYQTGLGLKDASMHYVFLCVVAGVFFLFLSSLFWYHLFLVLNNRSTLEEYRPPVMSNGQENKFFYDLGCVRNIEQIFGQSLIHWFIPTETISGDGLSFPRSYTFQNIRNCEEANDIQESHSLQEIRKSSSVIVAHSEYDGPGH